MKTKIFRSHDYVPAVPESPLYRQLLTEWVQLNTKTGAQNAVTRWGRLEPALAGHTRPADIVDAVDAADRAGKDTMIGALIRLHHGGHQLAGRVVMQLMLPKLSALAKHSHHGRDNVWSEDRRHNVIAAFWEILTDYPITRRPQSVAAGLALDTLHLITNAGRATEGMIPVDDQILEHFENTSETRTTHRMAKGPESGETLDTDATLDTVVVWGTKHGVITDDEGALLLDAYSPTRGHCDFDSASKSAGISIEAARKRCTRARQRLTNAIYTELNPTVASERVSA